MVNVKQDGLERFVVFALFLQQLNNVINNFELHLYQLAIVVSSCDFSSFTNMLTFINVVVTRILL